MPSSLEEIHRCVPEISHRKKNPKIVYFSVLDNALTLTRLTPKRNQFAFFVREQKFCKNAPMHATDIAEMRSHTRTQMDGRHKVYKGRINLALGGIAVNALYWAKLGAGKT